jgi:nucleoside-diphosphate-sugar epimerase
MKIAITGASGFIGHHVRKALTQSNNCVVLGVRTASKVTQLTPRETVVEIDLDQTGIDWYQVLGRPDAVVHLAWGGLPNYMDTYHVEIELPKQKRFLHEILDSGLRRLVVTGTCHEYGSISGALSEDSITNPITQYGIAKDLLRKELFERQLNESFDLTWARVFFPFGDMQADTSLYSQLRKCADSKIREFQLENPHSLIDLIPIEDVASALQLIVQLKKTFDIVNIGSGIPTSVENFARKQIALNKWMIDLKNTPNREREYEPKSFWADVSRLNKILDGTE